MQISEKIIPSIAYVKIYLYLCGRKGFNDE